MRMRKVFWTAAALTAVYAFAVRPRLLRWGATDEEVRTTFPGADPIAEAWSMRPRWLQRLMAFGFLEWAHWIMLVRQFRNLKRHAEQTPSALDAFVSAYDIREVHEIGIAAPPADVMTAALNMRLESIPIVRALFVLRALCLGMKPAPPAQRGLLDEMREIGWTVLEQSDVRVVLGCIAEPWSADPHFVPVAAERFAAEEQPNRVKIAWTLEAFPIAGERTRFRTETRAVATDGQSRRRFRVYWAAFGAGTALIRTAALRHLKSSVESTRAACCDDCGRPSTSSG